jgi:hypothetical protein
MHPFNPKIFKYHIYVSDAAGDLSYHDGKDIEIAMKELKGHPELCFPSAILRV